MQRSSAPTERPSGRSVRSTASSIPFGARSQSPGSTLGDVRNPGPTTREYRWRPSRPREAPSKWRAFTWRHDPFASKNRAFAMQRDPFTSRRGCLVLQQDAFAPHLLSFRLPTAMSRARARWHRPAACRVHPAPRSADRHLIITIVECQPPDPGRCIRSFGRRSTQGCGVSIPGRSRLDLRDGIGRGAEPCAAPARHGNTSA